MAQPEPFPERLIAAVPAEYLITGGEGGEDGGGDEGWRWWQLAVRSALVGRQTNSARRARLPCVAYQARLSAQAAGPATSAMKLTLLKIANWRGSAPASG